MGKKAQKRRQAKVAQQAERIARRAQPSSYRPGTVLPVTDGSFQSDVLSAEGLTLVDFWAPWCQPCKRVAPVVEELARDYAGKVRFAKLDTEKNPSTASRFGIRSIPSLLLFRNGAVVDSKVGALPKAALAEMIDASLV